MAKPTLKDVADLAGVHPGTASRALNSETEQMVSESTVERVHAAARQLGYLPNPLARALKTNKSKTVGMLIPDLTNALFPPIVRGAEEVLEADGYITLLANTDNVPDKEEAAFRRLLSRQVDGFLIATANRNNSYFWEAFEAGTPIVLINRTIDNVQLPAVVGDDTDGVRQAVSHLTVLGHKSICYISGPTVTSTGYSRKLAFQIALQEQGLTPRDDLIIDAAGYTSAAGAACAHQLFDRDSDFTAILCGNDMIALGALQAIEERGLRCPENISVVGFNDMPLIERLRPSLSSVRIPHNVAGAEAARLLLRLLSSASAPTTTVSLPAELIVRESSSTAPISVVT